MTTAQNTNRQNAAQAMRKAWAIAKAAAEETGKKASLFFREALKMAWAEIKNQNNLPELVGSVKQIAWANDLRPQILAQIDKAEEELNKGVEQYKDTFTAENWEQIEGVRKIFDAFRKARYADTFIDYRDVNLTELANYAPNRFLDQHFKAGYIK